MRTFLNILLLFLSSLCVQGQDSAISKIINDDYQYINDNFILRGIICKDGNNLSLCKISVLQIDTVHLGISSFLLRVKAKIPFNSRAKNSTDTCNYFLVYEKNENLYFKLNGFFVSQATHWLDNYYTKHFPKMYIVAEFESIEFWDKLVGRKLAKQISSPKKENKSLLFSNVLLWYYGISAQSYSVLIP